MVELLLLFAWLAFVLLIGFSAISLACKNIFYSPLELAALSYGIGLGLVTVEMAALSFFSIKFNIFSLTIFWTPFITAALLVSFKKNIFSFSQDTAANGKPLSLWEKFFISGITVEVFYAFFRALIRPIEAYDAIAIYGIKSKIFFLAKSIPQGFFTNFKDFVPHIEYPLLIPLAETSFYTFLNSLNDVLVKILFPLYYLAILMVLYYVCRRFLERKTALLFIFLLATVPQFADYASNGYADLPLAFYCSTSIFYLYLWAREKENSFLILSLILSALGIWTKGEGLMFACINMLLVSVCVIRERKFSKSAATYIVVLFAAVACYMFTTLKLFGTLPQSDFSKPGTAVQLKNLLDMKRISVILYQYQIQLFGPKKWNIALVLFVAGFILGFKKAFLKNIFAVTLAILLAFLGYTAVYMISPDLQWHLEKSVSRLLIHFLPVVILWLALMFKEEKLEL